MTIIYLIDNSVVVPFPALSSPQLSVGFQELGGDALAFSEDARPLVMVSDRDQYIWECPCPCLDLDRKSVV
jgi:hypothetical protein